MEFYSRDLDLVSGSLDLSWLAEEVKPALIVSISLE